MFVLTPLQAQYINLPGPTLSEILYGLGRLAPGQRRPELETKAVALFARIPGEPMRESAGDHYTNVKLARQKQGLAWDENDRWIAATALAVGATLVSRDTDFRPIAGLNVADWTARTFAIKELIRMPYRALQVVAIDIPLCRSHKLRGELGT